MFLNKNKFCNFQNILRSKIDAIQRRASAIADLE